MRTALVLLTVMSAGSLLATRNGFAGQAGTDGALETPPVETEDHVRFHFGAGAIHQLDTDVDGGGDFSVTRFNGIFNAESKLEEDLDLSVRLTYALDSYDFSDVGAIGGGFSEPWDDIHTAAAGALLSWQVDHRWTIF